MTNPDNVGGLPSQHGMARRLELAADRIAERAPEENARLFRDAAQCIQTLFNVKEALQGELCRAAPAGGDPKAPVFPSAVGPVIHEVGQAMWLLPDGADKARARLKNAMDLLRALQHIPPVDSAPAGSGEVSRLELAKMELAVTAALFNYEQGDTVSEWLKNTAALLRKLQQGAESNG